MSDRTEPELYLDDQGVERFLGCVFPTVEEAQSPFYSDVQAIAPVPRDRWTEVDYSAWLPPVLDQGSTPMCGGFSTAAAHTASCNMSGRKLGALLSPGWIYGYTKEPGGGILVRNALTCLQDRGCCTVNFVGQFDTNPAAYSQEARWDADKYRLRAAYQIDSFDQMGSALVAGYLVEFGVVIGGNFRPDADGVIPEWDGSLSGGHAMFAYGLAKVNGRWYARVRNSWGERWGKQGNCLMPESYFWKTRSGYRFMNLDAFAIKAVRQDVGELPTVAT